MKPVMKLSVILTAAVCLAAPMNAAAAEVCTTAEISAENENLRAAGLISSYYLLCVGGAKRITFCARTIGTEELAEIGIIDIDVQRSDDGVNGWTSYTSVPDLISTNATYNYVENYVVPVEPGYYRIMLTHYAKEKGWFFPTRQYADQHSVVVYAS